MTVPAVLAAAGRRRSPATMPGYHAGRPPRNKGQLYPADPPTVEEIIVAGALMRSRCTHTATAFSTPKRASAQTSLKRLDPLACRAMRQPRVAVHGAADAG